MGHVCELVDNGILTFNGCVSVGQVEQQRVPGRAFHERADRGLSCGSDDQVTFPVARGARSSTLAGRALINTIGSLNRGRTTREYAAGRLRARPWRIREAISLRSAPVAWMKKDW